MDVVTCGFFGPWLAPFPWAVGALTLALFAFLAAVYLANEVRDASLREDFRLRALWAALALGLTAHLTLWLAKDGAPRVFSGLWSDPASWILQGSTAAVSVGAIAALWRRRWRLARLLALSEAVLIVWGWALAQFPYLVFPSHTIDDSAAPEATLRPVAIARRYSA